MAPCVLSGLVCCHVDVDVTTCPPSTILCNGKLKLIALESNCCLAQGKEMMPIGMDKEYKGDGKICKVGLGIIDFALFKPDMKSLVILDGDLLCLSLKGELPFVYGCQCALKDGKPVFGCCTGPYQSGAFSCTEDTKVAATGGPDVVNMDR